MFNISGQQNHWAINMRGGYGLVLQYEDSCNTSFPYNKGLMSFKEVNDLNDIHLIAFYSFENWEATKRKWG